MIEQILEAISRMRSLGYEPPKEIPLTQDQYNMLKTEVEASFHMVADPGAPHAPMMFSGVPIRIVPDDPVKFAREFPAE